MREWSPPNPKYPPPKAGEPTLHRAARLGDHEAIRAAVAGGTPVDDLFAINLDPGGHPEPATPLMVAAGSGDGATVETVRLLLDLGASIEPGPSGLSALFYGCQGLGWNYPPGGDAERVAVLLAEGSDPNVARAAGKHRGTGLSALARAARTGDPDRVGLLLEAGANPSSGTPDLRFEVPIYEAAASGSGECVRLLLAAGAELHFVLSRNQVPVLASAASLEVLSVLLAAGADPNEPCGHGMSVAGNIARHAGCGVDERVAMLELLVDNGVDLNAPTPSGTPLSGAALAGDSEAVEALLAAGADPRGPGNPMAMVCFSGSEARAEGIERTVHLLVDAGLDPDDVDEHGYRPLHAALSPDAYGPGYQESDGFNLAAAVALLDRGASLDLEFPATGYRPLHAAAAAGSDELVARLLAEGEDLTARAAGGETALDVARAHLDGLEGSPPDLDDALPSFAPHVTEQLRQRQLDHHEVSLTRARRSVDLLSDAPGA